MADETELVEALRGAVYDSWEHCLVGVSEETCHKAADTIEALQRERDAMREGLNAIMDRGPERDIKWAGMNAHDIARAALSGEAS